MGKWGVYVRGTGCTIGAPGEDSLAVVSGNAGGGIGIYGAGATVLNAYIGVAADGTTAVPNMGGRGVYVHGTATDCTIGAPGEGRLVVVSGNAGDGIDIRGVGATVLNAYIGVAADGATAVANMGERGVYVDTAAADCTIGAPGEGSLVVVSGNAGDGIAIYSTGATVLNAYIGVAADGATAVPNMGEVGILVDRYLYQHCIYFRKYICSVLSECICAAASAY